MTIDHELIARVQEAAREPLAHRVKTMIACYIGFVGLLEQQPDLRQRALAIEEALRTFCLTGLLPPSHNARRRTTHQD